MTETDVATSTSPFQPGSCSDHPTLRLVTHKAAGLQWYGPPLEVVCPDLHHRPGSPERCRWCGGPLVPPGTPRWRTSERRAFCSSSHRLQAFRAAQRTPWRDAQAAGYRNRVR